MNRLSDDILMFLHFDLETRFAPQQRANRNFKKWPGNGVLSVNFELQMRFAPQPRAFFGKLNFQKVPGTSFLAF